MSDSLCCTVVSFVPFDILAEKPGLIPPRFFIEASDTKTPTLLRVETASHFVYMNESQGSLQVKDPPDVVARSIVDDYINAQLAIDDDSSPAIFWLVGDVKAAQILTEHKTLVETVKKRQANWFRNVARMADDDWKKYQVHTVISDFHRTIAGFLNLNPVEHRWMAPITSLEESMKPCPYCLSQIPKDASICATCGQVVDKKKHAELSAQKG